MLLGKAFKVNLNLFDIRVQKCCTGDCRRLFGCKINMHAQRKISLQAFYPPESLFLPSVQMLIWNVTVSLQQHPHATTTSKF